VDGTEFRRRCAEQGVLCTGTHPQRVRMVCHMDVSRDDIEAAIPIIASVLQSLPAAS